jgi:hypothetical protein
VFGQMIDDQIYEFDLVGAEGLAGEEARQRPFGGASIQADQRTDEQAETVRLLLGAVDLIGAADATVHQHALEFGQVTDGNPR